MYIFKFLETSGVDALQKKKKKKKEEEINACGISVIIEYLTPNVFHNDRT